MDEYGALAATKGESAFSHVPDWYAWERKCVREELELDAYALDTPVDVCMAIDTKAIYRVGEGRLTHTKEGLHLTGCQGELDYLHTPISSYSLYSDFNWYEVGDVICIGNQKALYYCFPKDPTVPVAKARLAAEELYKMTQSEKRRRTANA